MKTLKKIQQAREQIKSSPLKKLGRNKFSNYDYYTPEQVDKLVFDACKKVGLFNKYDLKRTEYGLVAQIQVVDLESGEKETFEIATDIPEIKATNISQQLGGAVTYSNRYLLMVIYDIVDNNLDFDSQNNKPEKEWLNPGTEKWDAAVEYLKADGEMSKILDKYMISKVNQNKLNLTWKQQ